MAAPKLHLDADTSRKSLWHALCERGYDVTRTPNEWMSLDAPDEVQLLGATAQRRSSRLFDCSLDVFIRQSWYTESSKLIKNINFSTDQGQIPGFIMQIYRSQSINGVTAMRGDGADMV